MRYTPFEMREPCRECGGPFGRVEERNGQACVYCVTPGCGRWVYNAPRTETGEKRRSVSTVHAAIKPKTRAHVLLRANSRCELCGVGIDDTVMHVGHLISVEDGLKEGLTDQHLNHQENLAAMCQECNLGIGKDSTPLRTLLRVTALRLGVRRKSE